jgi:Swiss Army Knife RNA repair-like protein
VQRIVFLDMDGVVNSHVWFEKMQADALSRRPISHMIDPECVARLNRLLDISGADVVISSSWRIVHILGEINAALKEKGFTGRIIGKTPVCGPVRGAEIQAWLTARVRNAEDIVILDDNSDMAHLTPRLVLTSWGVGLTDDDVDRAIALFGIEFTELTDLGEQPMPGVHGELVLASGAADPSAVGLRGLLGKAD